MIVVTVELWPHGDERRKRHLGTATIANDLSGTQDTGNYHVMLSKAGRPKETWRRGRVEAFPRLSRRLGVWDLLYRALRDSVGERNP